MSSSLPELCKEMVVRINGDGDLMMSSPEKYFIGKECVVIKKTKGGKILVYMKDNHKQLCSFAQRNIDIL